MCLSFTLDSFRFRLLVYIWLIYIRFHLHCTRSHGSKESKKRNVNKVGTSNRKRLWLNFEVHEEDNRVFFSFNVVWNLVSFSLYLFLYFLLFKKFITLFVLFWFFDIIVFPYANVNVLLFTRIVLGTQEIYLAYNSNIINSRTLANSKRFHILTFFYDHNSKAETKQHFG